MNMKKIKDAFSNEAQVPYIILAFLLIQVCMIILSLFDIGYGGLGVFYLAFLDGFSIHANYIFPLIINGLIIGLTVYALIRAMKHDQALSKKKKDEREMLHDQIVAVSGYKISIIGIVLYMILTGDPLIILLLIAILTTRFFQRIKLSNDQYSTEIL